MAGWVLRGLSGRTSRLGPAANSSGAPTPGVVVTRGVGATLLLSCPERGNRPLCGVRSLSRRPLR